jgi:hypothetical protein
MAPSAAPAPTKVWTARYQGAQVEGVELLVGQGHGHLVRDNHLSQTLDDGRLANPRLANEHGVVLGTPRQDLHHPFNFFFAAHQRVELAFTGELSEITAELVQDRRATSRFRVALLSARRAR